MQSRIVVTAQRIWDEVRSKLIPVRPAASEL
jgi:hypothetical protein